MEEKKAKIKKPWSAKKLIFTFLIIGVVLGLVICGLFFLEEMRFYEEDYANHHHKYYCYDYNGDLDCYVTNYVEMYDTAFDHALAQCTTFSLVLKIYFAGAVGGCLLIAGIILLVRKLVLANKKKNTNNTNDDRKTKQEKISTIVNNVLD